MILFPNCKINLGLNITGKRSDGFHDLETVFYPVALNDALEIIPAADGKFEFQSTGLPIPGEVRSNLCVKAFHLLKLKLKLPAVKIHLHKVIPIGSGLGGGSSDGAFTLKLLNILFETGLSNNRLEEYARLLGSDCAFFISNKPVYAHGRGDRFEPVGTDLSGMYLVLVFPDFQISTAEAFSMVIPVSPAPGLNDLIRLPIEQWKDRLVNDFEKPVFEKYPGLGVIKQQLFSIGAVYAGMSGSGSSIYGIFVDKPVVKSHLPENNFVIIPL